ncbi:MAG: WecB/TagA/CpsF family glycosyltransferase [bacterium]|nr:WecB/TagA/CpsF family glycosyltransferase [bacterium]
MDKINILGVNIANVSKTEALEKLEEYLKGQRQHMIVTPNPEIILAAEADQELLNIMNGADLAVLDGAGLQFAAWAMGRNLQRVAGADLLKDILAMAEEQGRRVAVFNWGRGLAKAGEIKAALADKFPGLEVYVEDLERAAAADLQLARQFAPDIVFCTFGAPWQEKFIYHNLPNLPSAKIGLGVGGSFDYLTGKLPRAPLWLRAMGLEWLWRLILQPRRWKRIYKAVIVFPVKFIVWLVVKK